ncbi:MAG TPA: family 16 glycoside hydrolase [Candidatus Sulfotelmatobacter sp.]|nr:family 16 glycoside hydrolase [Candidatus Sulfotelmatobacter sp.]
MKKLLCLLLVAASIAAADNSVSKPEADDGWILLFDGESIFGWTQQAGGHWAATGGVLAAAGDGGYLQSNGAYSDFQLQLSYRSSAADADCSVFLRAASDGDPADTGYQLQIGDARSDWPTGSIVDHIKAEAAHPALNQWHTLEATLSAEHITIKLDGRQVADGKNSRARAGVVALGCRKAGKVQFRDVRLKPLGAKVLFNGSDLSGWKPVGAPPPKKPGKLKKLVGGGGKPKDAQWSVATGAVHAQGGIGQLESTAMYDDFVLQVAARVNSHKGDHPKTGIFFRGDAGQLATGYEVSVMNEYKGGNRSQALAESTGGLKGLQPPRKVLGDDNQFSTITVAAHGRHVEVWVDGYPVTDFYDTRAEGTSPLKAARTTAGTISLLSPDEKANLDFRNIRLNQLPAKLGKGPAEAVAIQPPPVAVPPPPAPAPGQPVIMQGPAADPNKPKVQGLMAQSFATSDPEQQKKIYQQILELDPSNAAAATGLQTAQQKIDAANAQQAQQQAQQQQQSQTEAEKETEGEAARQKAETAFLSGDLDTAHKQIGVAQKSLSGNSGVQELASRIEAAIQSRTRLRMLWGGVGFAAIIGLITAWWASRGKKDPYLEVIEGMDKGKKYNLDQEVVHIGAVAEDGGNKNEIVVRDLERMISRFHCELHTRDGKFYLIDCNSANGTRVDGNRASPGKPVRVKSGARIELGGTCTMRLGWEKKK